ncbi:hypothetical protein M3Y99_01916200 [Aphelenchoides fujianensis]|nr:hypothetical protein M3Y99_01916200 [Aphelenchoides fujianensis]
MAEFAEESVEKLVPAFEFIRAAGILQPEHLAEFIRRCGRFEYRLQKRTKSVADYDLYIGYLKDFLEYWHFQQVLKRKKPMKKDVVRKSIQRKICWLFKVRSERFKKKDHYLEEARFGKKSGSLRSASEAYTRLLQIHGTNPELYEEAAHFEAKKNRSWENARTILQLALRKFPNNVALWTALLRTELEYVKYIERRHAKLVAAEEKPKEIVKSEQSDKGEAKGEREGGEDGEDQPEDEEEEREERETEKPKQPLPPVERDANDAVLRLDLARIVIEEAKDALSEAEFEDFTANFDKLGSSFQFANPLLTSIKSEVKIKKAE